MVESEIIEAIAKRWFERVSTDPRPKWDNQPDSLKNAWRERAQRFWDNPNELLKGIQMASCDLMNLRARIASACNGANESWEAYKLDVHHG